MKNDCKSTKQIISRFIVRGFYFALLFGFSTALQAQIQPIDQKVRLGLNVSPTLGWIAIDNRGYDPDGVRMGLKFGLRSEFRLFKVNNYAFSTGLFAHLTGGKMVHPGVEKTDSLYTQYTVNSTYKVSSINIPLTIKLKTNEIGYVVYWGQFGVDAGFNFRAREDRTLTNASENSTEKNLTANDKVNIFYAGLDLQLGVELNISGNTNVVLGVGYTNGFTPLFAGSAYKTKDGKVVLDNNGNPVYDSKFASRQNYFTLVLGIMF